jgi:hypothetical protein
VTTTELPTTLSAETLLLGAATSIRITVPTHVINPGWAGDAGVDGSPGGEGSVVLRPLALADVQLIAQAAKDNAELTAVLMVQRALVHPAVSIEQVSRMHAGLVEFLLSEVNRISGLQMSADEVEATVRAPLARAAFVLAREFGWTPEQCSALTIGQILLYLEMLARGSNPGRGGG